MTLESGLQNIFTKVFVNFNRPRGSHMTFPTGRCPYLFLSFCISEDSASKRSKKGTLDPESVGLAAE